ncbi:DUF4865 family protein [Demequina sp. NBRC 110056]|uniref:DUF4865 family protein n=1 Tax=Demequina sp. NBRC 110056 TaxID=1570345 RepID=UPI0009FFB9C8|nr:DUF4865 family protein [Demequina sp. NBRC 110056]
MIALQCSVDLPRDYPMPRVLERIAADGVAHDAAPGLLWFAHAVRQAGADGATVHRYLMLSVWSNTSRLGAYLWDSGGFERVRAQYGHVDVALWPVAGLQVDRDALADADHLEVTTSPARPDSALSTIAEDASAASAKAMRSRDVSASLRCVDAASGATFGADLRRGLPRGDGGSVYALAHLAVPPAPTS